MYKQLVRIIYFLLIITGFYCTKVRTVKHYPNNRKLNKKDISDNEILERSEVILKFPMYALKMPPLINSRRRSPDKVDPIPVSCSSKNVTKALSELRRKIQCIPRDTVVTVVTPDGSTVAPDTVVVRRCGGMCSGGKKCVSARKQPVQFYVRTTHSRTDLVFCNTIEVMEDVECKCACAKKKKKCLQGVQEFDSASCKCVCTNQGDYEECLSQKDLFKWDPKTCSCKCKNEKIACTTGTVWVSDKCRCVRI